MDVRVKFFATYRETVGRQEATFQVPAGASVADLIVRVLEAYPTLARHRGAMIVAVNEAFAEAGTPLKAGDDVALLPPVSGGDSPVRLQPGPVDPSAVLRLVADPRAGAVVLFLGTVRSDPGVKALDYEAYESMAAKQMESVRAAAVERFDLTALAIVHRTGRLRVGEVSVAVACSAPHRQEAFAACEWAMEELKKIVPIWKTERE
jgi:molybdopterin synthase catalytic subunit